MNNKLLFTSGFTLIELTISTLVISIAVIGTLWGLRTATLHSADPMLVQQGIAIADSYLQEITNRPFPSAALPCAGTPPTNRSDYTNICDYRGIPGGGQVPTDVNGNAIAGLGAYNVQVNIDSSTANINGLTSAANQAIRIDVTVSHNSMTGMTFSAYRTRY